MHVKKQSPRSSRRSAKRWGSAGLLLLSGLLLTGWGTVAETQPVGVREAVAPEALAPPKKEVEVPSAESRAVFAGGCFWCSEADFEKVEGVIDVRSGYTGGPELDPTYEQVSRGATGHTEAIEVVYDPSRVSYEKLLEVFWRSIDPTVKNRQFCDRGSQYRSAILVSDSTEKKLAESGKAKAASTLRKPVFTEIEMATKFYPAEEYHQDYYLKNPLRYKYYRFNCGRDQRLAELWGDPAAK